MELSKFGNGSLALEQCIDDGTNLMRYQMHLKKIEKISCILHQVASETLLLMYLKHASQHGKSDQTVQTPHSSLAPHHGEHARVAKEAVAVAEEGTVLRLATTPVRAPQPLRAAPCHRSARLGHSLKSADSLTPVGFALMCQLWSRVCPGQQKNTPQHGHSPGRCCLL